MKNSFSTLAGAVMVAALAVTGVVAPTAAAPPAPLTNLSHLDFLLDTTSPPPTEGHTTYRLDSEPALTVPWTYADARDGGTFERVGGGPLDPATGYWGQGAFNTDDITRAAVVYVRHWQQTGSDASREKAYELLRSVAYMQTTTGPNAGNVVLWMQPDGTLNPSPVPVELPDPSDGGASYWLARSLWAFGEGYAAFKKADPAFASFLSDRLQLGVAALDRQVLGKYGQFEIADGKRVPAWLIVNGADASSEAVLGLSAYVEANRGHSSAARTALSKLARGIALMGTPTDSWPYGAVLPWAESRSMWHAWASQMPAALAASSAVLRDRSLLKPALADTASFTPTLLTASGPDNGWYPTPTEQVQIAYGADSRLQSLLAVADVADRPGLEQLAAIEGAWYFGMNRANEPVYNPATGVTYDGVQADGSINRNSGAESTIHGLLSMLALDAHPAIAARAQAVSTVSSRDGLTVVQAETATGGTVVTPSSSWTGESSWGGGSYLQVTRGETATIPVGTADGARVIEPVIYEPYPGKVVSTWWAGRQRLGTLRSGVGAPGITEADGALVPSRLSSTLSGSRSSVSVVAKKGTVDIDALIVRPVVSRLVLTGSGRTELVNSAARARTDVGAAGVRSTVRIYDSRGSLVSQRTARGVGSIVLPAGGFAVVTS